jgi:hypothetical protein
MEREAKEAGWEPEVRDPLPDFPDQWGVICERHAVTSPDFVREADDFFQGLADGHGAEYDGWEASARRLGGFWRGRLGGPPLDLDPR